MKTITDLLLLTQKPCPVQEESVAAVWEKPFLYSAYTIFKPFYKMNLTEVEKMQVTASRTSSICRETIFPK